MISRRLRIAVKNSSYRQYQLAHAINVDHSTLSAWLNGISRVREADPRVLQLGSILGVPPRACFQANTGRRQLLRRRTLARNGPGFRRKPTDPRRAASRRRRQT
jgi:transcriptional regulator with XRE-family HTH domain